MIQNIAEKLREGSFINVLVDSNPLNIAYFTINNGKIYMEYKNNYTVFLINDKLEENLSKIINPIAILDEIDSVSMKLLKESHTKSDSL